MSTKIEELISEDPKLFKKELERDLKDEEGVPYDGSPLFDNMDDLVTLSQMKFKAYIRDHQYKVLKNHVDQDGNADDFIQGYCYAKYNFSVRHITFTAKESGAWYIEGSQLTVF